MSRHRRPPPFLKLPITTLIEVGKFLSTHEYLTYITALSTYLPDLLSRCLVELIDNKSYSTIETLTTKLLSTKQAIPSLPIFAELASTQSLPYSLTLLAAHADYKCKTAQQGIYWKSQSILPETILSYHDIEGIVAQNSKLIQAQASTENLNTFLEKAINYINLPYLEHYNLISGITMIVKTRGDDINPAHLRYLVETCIKNIKFKFFNSTYPGHIETLTELLHELYNYTKHKVAFQKSCEAIYHTALNMLIPTPFTTESILERIKKHISYYSSHTSHLLSILDKPNKIVNHMLFYLHMKIKDIHIFGGLTDTALYELVVSILSKRAHLEANSELSIPAIALRTTDDLPIKLKKTLSPGTFNKSETLKINLLAMIRVAVRYASPETFRPNTYVSQLITFYQLYLEDKQKNRGFRAHHDQVIRALINTLNELAKYIVNPSTLSKIVRFAMDAKDILLSSMPKFTGIESTTSLDALIKLFITLSLSYALKNEALKLIITAIHLCATYYIDKEALALLQTRIKQYNTIHGLDNPLIRHICETLSNPPEGRLSYETATILITVVDSSLLNQGLIGATIKTQLARFQELSTSENPLQLIHALQTLALAISDNTKRQEICNTLLLTDNTERRMWAYRIVLKIPCFFTDPKATETALSFMSKNIRSVEDLTSLYSLIPHLQPHQYSSYIKQISLIAFPISYPEACRGLTLMRHGIKYLTYFDYLELQSLTKLKEYNAEEPISLKTSILELLHKARKPMSKGDGIFAEKIQSLFRAYRKHTIPSSPKIMPRQTGTFSQLIEYLACEDSWDSANRKASSQQPTFPVEYRSLTFRELSGLLYKHFIADFKLHYPRDLVDPPRANDTELEFLQFPIPTIKECSDKVMQISGGHLIGCISGFTGCTIWGLTPILTTLPQWGVITNSVFASLFMAATLLLTIYYAWHTSYYNEVHTKYKQTISSLEGKKILKACSNLNHFFSQHPLYKHKSSSRADCHVALAKRFPHASIEALGFTE